MPIIKEKRGGKRIGAGRKKKAPTQVLSFRVTPDQAQPIKELVNTFLNR